jgi:glycosyltransferase involved in cell wall biosynthesis
MNLFMDKNMYRPSIGLAMILKNEADNLPQLFKSIEGCFDQICITDTGSTDKTKEIALAFGAEVYDFTWCDDFSKARDASFQPMKTDYIVWLDGDDVLEGREDFIKWRDDIMHLADLWLANYIYASYPDMTPACTFVRERVVKRSKDMKWKYFIHEGIIPPENTKTQFIPSWRVRHKRTELDLTKDRSRNLSIFQRKQSKEKIDARMSFYFGKELFEAGKHFDSIRKLEDVLASGEEMELHDRILAMQYLGMGYMHFNEFEKAISICLTGLQLAPQRAEFFMCIGDSYLKLNQFMNAIPFFQGAFNCVLPQGNHVISPIYYQSEAYTTYPRNQLAKIYANLGSLDKAKSVALECYEMYRHPETKGILDEIDRISKIIGAVHDAKPCDDIVFTGTPTSPYLWDGDEYRAKAMGGSETACIEMAEWIAKLSGRPVKVFNARPDVKQCNGVEYRPINGVNEYMAVHKPYLHIAWRHTIHLTDAPTFIWCHDLLTPGLDQVQNYIKAIALTPFHSDFMHNMQLVPYDKIYVSRNGIRPERFKGEKPIKNANKIVFPSSPDRGLDRAMLIMDEVIKEFPNVELHVFYGIEHLPQWGHKALHDKLIAMFQSRPWVKYHGKTEQTELANHLKESVIWLHPCDFIETSCITAMEMIASGVYPVTRRLGGLKDTLKWAEDNGLVTLLNHDCVTPEEFAAYTKATLDALKFRKWEAEGFASFDPDSISWESVAKTWLKELPELCPQTIVPMEGIA